MENFIVSARKYRPTTFSTVIGQETITQTLKNSISTGHLGQAYLFCGPRGVGKTTCARIFAKTINCQNLSADVEACNECESCKSFNNSTSFNIFELDAASNNSVDDIRQLIDQVRIPPQVGKYSVYIIDEVHMLSQQAFNAFLKTLEEPPRHAIFILATTEKHKIIPTIISRCQIFDFNRIKIDDIVRQLTNVAQKEGITIEPEAANVIATKASGGLRDALSIFDQIVSFSGKNVTYQSTIDNLNVLDYEYFFTMTNYFLAGDYSSALITFDEILNKGFDDRNFLLGLCSHFRDLLVSKDPRTLKLLEVSDKTKQHYMEQSAKCSPDFLFSALDISQQFDEKYKESNNKRLHIELAMLQLCNIVKKKNEVDAPAPKPVESTPKQINKPIEKKVAEPIPEQPKTVVTGRTTQTSQIIIDTNISAPSVKPQPQIANLKTETEPEKKVETPIQQQKKYSPEEQYSELAKINPLLNNLKDRLDLRRD